MFCSVSYVFLLKREFPISLFWGHTGCEVPQVNLSKHEPGYEGNGSSIAAEHAYNSLDNNWDCTCLGGFGAYLRGIFGGFLESVGELLEEKHLLENR